MIKFRASEVGSLMGNSRSGEGLSETAKTTILNAYARSVYGRTQEISSKYLTKGNEREPDAITLISRYTKLFLKKNSERLENDYISGEPDIFIGKEIRKAEKTLDAKSSWSLNTFLKAKSQKVDKDYWYQGHCYMWLTGAKHHTVAPCLLNGTGSAIMDEKRKLAYAMNILDPTVKNDEYLEKCRQIEINHIFDLQGFMAENEWFELDNIASEWKWDIPMEERIALFPFECDQEVIEKIKTRITEAREWADRIFPSEREVVQAVEEAIVESTEAGSPLKEKVDIGKKLYEKVKKTRGSY